MKLTQIAPWSTDTPELLTRPLTHRSTVTLAGNGTDLTLELTDGRVTFDETRAPRVSAQLVTRVPEEQQTLDRIDPRAAVRVQVAAGYVRPDGLDDVQPLVDLGLRTRTVARPEDTLTLEAAGDEALLIDDAPSNGGTASGSSTLAAILQTVRRIFPSLTMTTTGTPAGAAVNQSPVGDKWQLVADLSDRLGAQTYDNGLRQWFTQLPPELDDYCLELAVGIGGTLVTSDTSQSRDDGFYNRVFLAYEWTDTGGVDRRIVAVRSITSGPYAAAVGNVRTYQETRNVPTTQAEADAAATSLVKRTVTRGRSFQVTAPSAYWLRPGHTVKLTLPLGDPELHLVTAVTFDLATGFMDVTTRLPDGVYTIGA